MKQSDSIANLAKGLIQAQKAIQASVAKNATNATFGSDYADLGAVIEAIKSHLNGAGIVVLQSPTLPDKQGNVCLTTRLVHETGEWMEDTCSTPMAYLDPQGFGSAVSYLRRYALTAMMGLYQAESDDDGSAATGSGATRVTQGEAEAANASNAAPANAESAPATGDSTEAQAQGQGAPQEEALPANVQKRVDSWLKTISNASLERLETSRGSAKENFKGRALQIVDQAFEKRINELKASKQPVAA